jgi:dihydrofolate reductase
MSEPTGDGRLGWRHVARIVYFCAASLDGYIAESDDTIEWLTGYEGSIDEPEGLEQHPLAPGGPYERFYAGVGALISGSVTYEFILGHTPPGTDWPYPDKPYWVLSSRELRVPDDATEVRVVSAGIRDLIDEMRAAAGELDIWIIGGGNVASQFADEGLLDELHVTVVPVVLGGGKPLFDRRLQGGPLKLLGTRVFGNGMVELRYARR